MGIKERGFASMDRERRREIASKGGRAAHEKGTAHEWTSDEAREAGRKGGLKSHQPRIDASTSERVVADDDVGIVGVEVSRKDSLS